VLKTDLQTLDKCVRKCAKLEYLTNSADFSTSEASSMTCMQQRLPVSLPKHSCISWQQAPSFSTLWDLKELHQFRCRDTYLHINLKVGEIRTVEFWLQPHSTVHYLENSSGCKTRWVILVNFNRGEGGVAWEARGSNLKTEQRPRSPVLIRPVAGPSGYINVLWASSSAKKTDGNALRFPEHVGVLLYW